MGASGVCDLSGLDPTVNCGAGGRSGLRGVDDEPPALSALLLASSSLMVCGCVS